MTGKLAKQNQSMDSKDLVKSIPGNIQNSRNFDLDVISYAGHIKIPAKKIDTKYDSYIYYWFFESQNSKYTKNSGEVPILIWLNGGPGASSLAGLFMENGPFLIEDNDSGTIVQNPYTWNREVHLLYIDQPVQSGYSYTDPAKNYVHSEFELSQQFYFALQGFLNLHPEYCNCPLYISGESYAGKYIPHIAWEIMENIGKNSSTGVKTERDILLKGIAIGDGWMNPKKQTQVRMEYGYTLGFVDTKQYQILKRIYIEFCTALAAENMKEAFTLGNLIRETILKCGGFPDIYDVRNWSGISIDILKTYLNHPEVKRAIHVPDDIQWKCSTSYKGSEVAYALINDYMRDVTPLISKLLDHYNLKTLMYTGNFDMSCGYLGTELILQELSWYGQEEWTKQNRKVWLELPNHTLGYVKSYEILTQMVIPDAGHLVPIDKPMISRSMITNWLFNREFIGFIPNTEVQRT